MHRITFLTRLLVIFVFRYRISGSSLLAAMDQSSQVPYADVLTVQSGDLPSSHLDDKEQNDGSYLNVNREKMKNNFDLSLSQVNDETLSRADERSGRVQPTVDVAEIIRRWTHALQRIHKQSLHLVCYLAVVSIQATYYILVLVVWLGFNCQYVGEEY